MEEDRDLEAEALRVDNEVQNMALGDRVGSLEQLLRAHGHSSLVHNNQRVILDYGRKQMAAVPTLLNIRRETPAPTTMYTLTTRNGNTSLLAKALLPRLMEVTTEYTTRLFDLQTRLEVADLEVKPIFDRDLTPEEQAEDDRTGQYHYVVMTLNDYLTTYSVIIA